MLKLLTFFAVLFVITFSTNAQDLAIKRFTISAAGATLVSPSGKLMVSYSVGQPSLVSQVGNNNTVLTQGFIQPNRKTVSYKTPRLFYAFPNPTNGKLTILLQKKELSQSVVSIYDLQGNLKQEIAINGDMVYAIDMSDWTRGMYTLVLRNQAGSSQTMKVVLK